MGNNLILDSDSYYRMPFIMGPLWKGGNPQFNYLSTEVIAFQYLTDTNAITALLPACYKCGEEPLVTVIFGYHNGLNFMAGGGYRIAAVLVSARFDGDKDHLEGDYILIMFEDDTWPIIGGREDLGVPKLFADISLPKVIAGGNLKCEASLWGHYLFGLELSSPKVQNRIVRLTANKLVNSRYWMGYKYIPSLDGPPDADYPTITKNDTKINELWFSKSGELAFGNAGIKDIAQVKYLIDALKTLKIISFKRALHFKGSAILRYDLSRRLK
jgi:acetoacetate decarboxylase